MKITAPSDPRLRRIVLPSIIRISDARTGRRSLQDNSAPGFQKPSVTSHAVRVQIGQ